MGLSSAAKSIAILALPQNQSERRAAIFMNDVWCVLRKKKKQ
jgi:hypothetical protein